MSTESATPVPAASGPAPVTYPVLDNEERRVLGVLIEKQKTTPDVYPMSLNALVTGCNQKSNRDPVMNLNDEQVEEALVRAQKKGLAIRITGGSRVQRWRHNLYETWRLDKVEMAIIAELLLRGPQTEGELRTRASRMEPIDDLETLRSLLKSLAERGAVVYLTPEGRRGTMVTHGFHLPAEVERLKAHHGREMADDPLPVRSSAAPVAAAAPVQSERLTMLETQLGEARAELAGLRERVAELAEHVRKLQDTLSQVL